LINTRDVKSGDLHFPQSTIQNSRKIRYQICECVGLTLAQPCGGFGKTESFIRYQAILPRIFFVSERRRFDSTSVAFVPRERLAFRRRSLEASANCASFFASAASLIFCSSLRLAVSLFIACERESETVTLNPVGT
jgi:hypothetical protein